MLEVFLETEQGPGEESWLDSGTAPFYSLKLFSLFSTARTWTISRYLHKTDFALQSDRLIASPEEGLTGYFSWEISWEVNTLKLQIGPVYSQYTHVAY